MYLVRRFENYSSVLHSYAPFRYNRWFQTVRLCNIFCAPLYCIIIFCARIVPHSSGSVRKFAFTFCHRSCVFFSSSVVFQYFLPPFSVGFALLQLPREYKYSKNVISNVAWTQSMCKFKFKQAKRKRTMYMSDEKLWWERASSFIQRIRRKKNRIAKFL